VEDVDKARKFLLEAGQEATYENVNIIVSRYREGRIENGWKKIEDSRNKVWTKELYTIDPNKTNNIAIDFSEFKDKMVSNKVYRVVKRFVQNGDTNKEITVSAEFQMR